MLYRSYNVYSALYTVNSYQRNATVFVMSPPVETARQVAIELVLNNGLSADINRTFDYLSNPVFTDIRPRKHLIV